LAGGGYYNAKGHTPPPQKIERNTIPGAGITVNHIYLNPTGRQNPTSPIATAIVPIEGLIIGIGVQSIGVTSDYIATSGL